MTKVHFMLHRSLLAYLWREGSCKYEDDLGKFCRFELARKGLDQEDLRAREVQGISYA